MFKLFLAATFALSPIFSQADIIEINPNETTNTLNVDLNAHTALTIDFKKGIHKVINPDTVGLEVILSESQQAITLVIKQPDDFNAKNLIVETENQIYELVLSYTAPTNKVASVKE